MSTPPPPEPESVPAAKVAIALLLTVAIAALGAVLGRLLEHQARGPGAARPTAAGQPEIGRQFQRPFGLEKTAAEVRQHEHERLESYGWVDRKRELIHVPLERAYDAVITAEGER
ncbi:MAG: hypothetical protein QM723_12790 [Myxococcaceae bacterium]